MSKTVKAGILLFLVGIPSLAYIFLKIFATNQFDLPHYFPEMEENGEVKIVKGDTVFSKVSPFQLLNENSDTVKLPNNTITVINFFFTRCGTICPTMNAHLAQVSEVFKQHPDVQFIGITVDPKHDTPEILKNYTRKLGVESRNYQLLTGDKKYIYHQCIKNFKLPVADASEYDNNITDIDEMFIHSDKVLLIDKKGYFRGIYSGTSAADIDRLKVEIKVLLSQNSNDQTGR